jgi:hypothetical protein
LNLFDINLKSKLIYKNKSKAELKLNFESLFTPGSIHNLRILTSMRTLSNSKHFKLKKIIVKQSYLLLFWFKFLSKHSASLLFLPTKGQLHLTKTKSPMAQKTFSQEQYKFVTYKYTTKRVSLKSSPLAPKTEISLSEALFSIMSVRGQSLFFGTSMLFVSKVRLYKLVTPSDYFILTS